MTSFSIYGIINQCHPIKSATGTFFLGVSKYRNGVYQRGQTLYDQYTMQTLGYSNWVMFGENTPTGKHPNYPGRNDWEVYRWVYFTAGTDVNNGKDSLWRNILFQT